MHADKHQTIDDIRIIESRDFQLLSELNQEVQDFHFQKYPEIFKEYDKGKMNLFFKWAIKKAKWIHFVAYKNDNPIGFTQIQCKKYGQNAIKREYSVIYINQICITSSNRNRGVGRALVNRIIEYSNTKKINRIELDVWSINESAKAFFCKVGFRNQMEKMYLILDK